MKYIKRFENGKEYSVKDFNFHKYWRYRNSSIDAIMCLKYPIKNEKINIEFLELKNRKFFETFFTFYSITELFDLKDEIKIFRPATDEEIEIYEIEKNSRKYNL